MKKYAIIVAGGIGTRMKSDIPKQFMCLANQPILMHTVKKFYSADNTIKIVVVLARQEWNKWKSLTHSHGFDIPHELVAGGDTRFQSVKNALSYVTETGLVAVHDGVRPFVSMAIIRKCFEIAAQKGSAIVTVSIKDSIRKVAEFSNQSVPRQNYRLVQTPQVFRTDIITKAYMQQEEIFFTDDASVVEQAGHTVYLITGDYKNIKITTPEDLLFAKALTNSNQGLS